MKNPKSKIQNPKFLNYQLSIINSGQGFTLIELLVVIAIIGILAAIVLVGINPAKQIADANLRAAQGNVNQAAKVVDVCVTDRLAKPSDPNNTAANIYSLGALGCGNAAYLVAQQYTRNFPTTVTLWAAAGTALCLTSPTSGTVLAWYSTTTGEVRTTAWPGSCS